MKLECRNNNPVVNCKELDTPVNPAVLEDPPTHTNQDVINLLSFPTIIVIPSLTVQLWNLIPRTCNSQPSEFCKIQKDRAVGVPGTRAIGTNT